MGISKLYYWLFKLLTGICLLIYFVLLLLLYGSENIFSLV